jgi:hypothetical protein
VKFQDFINTLTSWLPNGLEPLAQLLIYFVILGAMAATPVLLWLGWAVASTRRRTP